MSIGPIIPGAVPPPLPPPKEHHGGHGHGGKKVGSQIGVWGQPTETQETKKPRKTAHADGIEGDYEKDSEEDKEEGKKEKSPPKEKKKGNNPNQRRRSIMDFINIHMKKY